MTMAANDLEEEFFAVEGRPAIPFPVVDYGPVIRDLELRYESLNNTARDMKNRLTGEPELLAVQAAAQSTYDALTVLWNLRDVQQRQRTTRD